VGMFRRLTMTVAAVGAAGALVAGGSLAASAASAATTSGVRYQQVQSATILFGPSLDQCSVIALSAAPSIGSPAYVSAVVENWTTNTCTGWVESSVGGGAWTNVSPQQVAPGGLGPNNPSWFKTGNYYAGPGTSVRACIEAGPSTAPATKCTNAVTLAASTAAPADDATGVYYAERQLGANANVNSSECFADVNSSTAAKSATSQANLTLQVNLGIGDIPCTGWLESSSDAGKTWTQVTPTYSLTSLSGETWAFSPAVADGTGQLVRACAQGTGAKVCGKPW